MARARVLAVGDAILDIVTPPLPPAPPGDRQSSVDAFAFLPGGNATNFAMAANALGADASLVACIGRDWAGDRLAAAMRRARLRTRLLRSDEPTGTTLAVTQSDGTRHLITSPGANARLRVSDVPRDWIRGADHVHRAGFWWATGLMGEPSRLLLRAARRGGARTSLDVSTDPEGWTAERTAFVRHVLPEVDVFFGNEVEIASVVAAGSLEEAVDRIRTLGVDEVVVHQGDRGASAFTETQVAFERAVPSVPRNPTGCGDVFNAAYVIALERGLPVAERLRFANAAAALHLERPGAPYPTARELGRLRSSRGEGRGAPPPRARARPVARARPASRRTRRRA